MIAGRTGPLACVGCLCLSLVGLVDRPARAAGFGAVLEYAALPSCPDAPDLKSIVTARLGYDPFTDDAANHVVVRISARAGSLDGSIEWRDATGRWAGDQTFSRVGGDCLPLVRAMGLALAVQIQLLATAAASEAPDGPVAAPAEPRSATQTAPPESPAERAAVTGAPVPPPAAVPELAVVPPTAASGPRPAFAMGAGPSLGFGLSSAPILLGRVFGVVGWSHVSLEVGVQASYPALTRRADGAGISQQYLLVNAAVCAPVWRWNACLVANAGEVRLVGEIDRPTSARLPFVDAGARAGVIQPLGPHVFLSAYADGLVILTRWTATLDQVPVWTSPRLAAAIAVAGGVRFR